MEEKRTMKERMATRWDKGEDSRRTARRRKQRDRK